MVVFHYKIMSKSLSLRILHLVLLCIPEEVGHCMHRK